MEDNKYITPVKEPTEWVSSMVVSSRKDKIRICIDPKDLNLAIKREHYPMRSIDDVISEIPGGKVFSKLDAKSGFLQIMLDKQSSYLTTFSTPMAQITLRYKMFVGNLSKDNGTNDRGHEWCFRHNRWHFDSWKRH